MPATVQVGLDHSGSDLYQSLAAEAGVSIHRLRVTKGSDGSLVRNARDFTVESTGLREQSIIHVKDLGKSALRLVETILTTCTVGPQIAWRTVFIVEYLGPLLIHPLIYFLRPWIYRNAGEPSELQTLSLILITLHFIKREIETLFVHRFSLATMPARNIFKNSAHYWVFAGANLAYWIYSPNAPTAKPSNHLVTYTAFVLLSLIHI